MRRTLSIFTGIVLAFALLPRAQADQWNEMTKLTFNQPVELPGRVLPAGTYWFVLFNSQSNRNIVQVFSSDWLKLYATLPAATALRTNATNRTEIKFAERPHDKPEALLKWFYPGSLTGHEFLYSKRHEKEFARDGKVDVRAHAATS